MALVDHGVVEDPVLAWVKRWAKTSCAMQWLENLPGLSFWKLRFGCFGSSGLDVLEAQVWMFSEKNGFPSLTTNSKSR